MKEIKLSDYKRPFYWIKSTHLDFDLYEDKTIVETTLKIERNSEYNSREELILDGVDLKIISIQINNVEVTDYKYENNQLRLSPSLDQFELKTNIEIHPEKNFTLDGLYKSGSIFCTQCEAEGFRRITFFQDRPDVMSKFTTKIKADKKMYPSLLSNGNKIDSGDLSGGRHFAVWEDPHLKPSYLFALVAGDLAIIKDTFVTKSNREVSLEFFVDHGNEDKVEHAVESLKNSMKWDEEKFGLEYDLDIYMIVAVDSFNMGAMENKGLNIFNSSYVLAKKETATDADFQGIEAVIAHEYFHNWTGNRVTCRDWFQLTLKEGLTVFRDQEFSADMLSRPVKRIEDVATLRAHQFSEDAGPMSHPIKPKSYIEINNFYTSTIYEKGAEVIRMVHTLIGADNFRKGMDLYFERHDGQAVTTEDFIAAMSDASGVDLEQFKVWYDQNGTPKLQIDSEYKNNVFSFTINQVVNTNNEKYDALHMPFSYALYSEDGEVLFEDSIELTKKSQSFKIDGIKSNPIPSWNRGFSAPIILDIKTTEKELITRMSHDKDTFNQYDAAQALYFKETHKIIELLHNSKEANLSDEFVSAFGKLLSNREVEYAFLAYALSLPSQMQVNQKLSIHDYDNVKTALEFIKKNLGEVYYKEFISLYNELKEEDFSLSAQSMGKRDLRKVILSYLSSTQNTELFQLLSDEFKNANNMNDEISLLRNIIHFYPEHSKSFSQLFFEKWKSDTLVMQKWLMTLASSPNNTLEDIAKLENSSVYDSKVPNLVSSVNRGFIGGNPSLFNSEDGSGYRYLTDKIIMTDKFNPSLASRMAKSLNHGARVQGDRRKYLLEQLNRLKSLELSKDTFEVVSKNLEAF